MRTDLFYCLKLLAWTDHHNVSTEIEIHKISSAQPNNFFFLTPNLRSNGMTTAACLVIVTGVTDQDLPELWIRIH
jgi:hypothetical protein